MERKKSKEGNVGKKKEQRMNYRKKQGKKE